jgi:methyl-accepting chemotaxis protein
MNMTNWKIGTRIAAGYAVLTLLTMALGAFAYLQMGSIDTSAKRITEDSLPGIFYIGQLKTQVLQRYSDLQAALLTSDPAETARLSQEIHRLKVQSDESIAAYEKTIHLDEDRQLFAAMKAARIPYIEAVAEASDPTMLKNNKRRAIEILEKQANPRYRQFSIALDALVDFNKREGEKGSAGIVESLNKAGSGILLVLGLALVLAFVTSVWVTKSIVGPMGAAVAHLERLSKGDFLHQIPSEYLERGDEVGVQSRAMQAMSLSLRSMIQEVSGGIRTLASSSASLKSTSADMNSGSQDASHKAHMVAAAAEEMSGNVGLVAGSMEQATTSLANVAAATQEMTATISEIAVNSERARSITAEATRQASRISEQMNQLGDAAREIGKVTEAITEISSQTNLLALNATIEAARAGAAGKGFAVVANEIKALAQQTAGATEDIKARIGGVQSSTAQSVGEIRKVSEVIAQVSEIVSSIAAAIEEQAAATKDIARNINEASLGVQDTNVRIAESAQVTNAIANDIVAVHQAATGMARGSDSMSQGATELATVADRLRESVAGFQV